MSWITWRICGESSLAAMPASLLLNVSSLSTSLHCPSSSSSQKEQEKEIQMMGGGECGWIIYMGLREGREECVGVVKGGVGGGGDWGVRGGGRVRGVKGLDWVCIENVLF